MASRNTPPFPTIIQCHVTPHYLCFHYVLANHSVCHVSLSVRLSVSIPTAPLSSSFLSIVFCCRRVTPTHCCIFTSSSFTPLPFSMYICRRRRHRRLPLALPAPPTRTFYLTCFISPFFTAVHEMGCMYDDVCLSPLSWKLGKKRKIFIMRAQCSDSFAFALWESVQGS
jgi:hypothetical protein